MSSQRTPSEDLEAAWTQTEQQLQYGTKQEVYISRDIQARSSNHCYRGTAVSITYSECVYVALGIRQAMRMRRTYIVICGMQGSTIFLHIFQ